MPPAPPPAGATAQNSQRDLHPIGGDRRGRVWDPPEVAGGEWGRLKHIICHGAHFFLGWGWSGRHRKRPREESLSPTLPLAAQFEGRTGRLFGRKVKVLVCVGHDGDLPGRHPVPPPGPRFTRQKDGGPTSSARWYAPSHRRAFGSLRGIWHSMVKARSPLLAPRPPRPPARRARTPCLPY